MIKKLDGIIDLAKGRQRKRIVVPVAADEYILKAVYEANELGLVDVSLVGCKDKIWDIADELNMNISGYEIINENDSEKAIKISIDMIKSGNANMLMKGMQQTADILKAVLDKEAGLRQGNRILSHLVIMETENYPKLLFITDVALNVAPNLKQKAYIIQNAVDVSICLGNEKPKVAVLSALEIVNPDMPCTLDAAALSKMAERGQIKNCLVDGPLAFDNAVCKEAATKKGIVSSVAGDADILLVPDIEAGNMLYKGLCFLGGLRSLGGVIVGAKIPMVVVSRAESASSKLYSIALASVLSNKDN